ncbi:Lrp/AsnC family transcriptional regulator [Pararhodobacter oceanensis]|uniref:AsnC family transcriptional regulator n=1 Tax=Pararhodobacter oceanensis TaxID=2172121 RepID=A0A2T8HYS5_9RHOB|nr:Lrp/AsnC family transcriptional regulator [Pararhodobacter oceanensis]PVH30587.1 AsnC family transcriptional regulator [Pararhodobacter oceanensis]
MHRLDERDIAILRALAEDGRITKTALAARVGLTPTPCWERLAKLEKSGLIEGYGARFNLRKLGASMTVFVVVELADHTAASFRAFEAAVQRYDEVTGCWALGGGYDYLMQVITKDIESYQSLMDAMLEAKLGVSRYFSYIVTKPVKSQSAPPFELLTGS